MSESEKFRQEILEGKWGKWCGTFPEKQSDEQGDVVYPYQIEPVNEWGD